MIPFYKQSCAKIKVSFHHAYDNPRTLFPNNICIFCKNPLIFNDGRHINIECSTCEYVVHFKYKTKDGLFRCFLDCIVYKGYTYPYTKSAMCNLGKYIIKSQDNFNLIDFQTLLNEINVLGMHDCLHLIKFKY